MLSTVIKSLLAHKVRLSMTALSVVLGVAFVAGTLVLTDTLRATFDDLFAEAYADIDVAVMSAESDDSAVATDASGVPVDVVDRITAVEGVAAAMGDVQGTAVLLDLDGEQLGNPQAPSIAGSVPTEEGMSAVVLREGRFAETADEVVVDVGTATTEDLVVGDRVQVVADGPATTHTIVGFIGYGDLDNLAGATMALFDPDTAFERFNTDGGYAMVTVAADGVDHDVLRDRIARAIGADYEVLTSAQLGEDAASQVTEGLGIITTALLVFAGISLFVGSFIIANTFGIIVAQRTRELALLRAVGASRRQVVASVLGEALAVGVVGSVVGVGVGVGVAAGLRSVLDTFGLTLPEGPLVVEPATAVVGLAVGVVVTTLAAIGPALRAVRVPPVAALQAVAVPATPRGGRVRNVLGVLVLLGGLAVMSAGLLAGGGAAVAGGGAAMVMVGMSLLAAVVARPVVGLMGVPIARVMGIRGDLARQNAMRNPTRTASTASALMIGLGLVTFTMIFASSITASTSASIDESFLAEFNIRSTQVGPVGIPEQVVGAVESVDGVAAVNAMTYTDFTHAGTEIFGAGVDPATFGQTLVVDEVEGAMADLAEGGVAVKAAVAEDEGWHVGDVVDLTFPSAGEVAVPIRAVFEADVDTSWLFDNATVREVTEGAPLGQLFVRLADGVDVDEARADLEVALGPFPTARLMDQAELKADLQAQVDQMLGLMSALLVLSIVIALVGIVNTLGLSVYERIRELGLLRAVGASRRQVRAMVRWEAVLIAGLGATLGLAIGVTFGRLMTLALADQGISTFEVPAAQLVIGFVAAALAGIAAAILPARRASRVDVLKALQMS
ncbi:ABC transporter permease [Euzebya sp.]|uniref:ABC transporter permease n=1 Tax=Euzebya sp. TaxID=1971409 RepID=UPI0035147C4D